jgi:hypothetical protein
MSKFKDIVGFQGHEREYKGPLLGVCINCEGLPKIQRSTQFATFRVSCRCGNHTLEYGDMGSAAKAWNDKSKRKVGE